MESNAYQRINSLMQEFERAGYSVEEALYFAFKDLREDFGPDIGPEEDWRGYYRSHDRSCYLWENRLFGIARLEGISLAREISLAAGA
jgi:hypothetical protein